MTQDLEGIDIYECPFFEVDSSGRLKFISGAFYDRTPGSFKNINEVYDVIRFCMWIIKKESLPDVSKYAAVVFMNRVNSNLCDNTTQRNSGICPGIQGRQRHRRPQRETGQ